MDRGRGQKEKGREEADGKKRKREHAHLDIFIRPGPSSFEQVLLLPLTPRAFCSSVAHSL